MKAVLRITTVGLLFFALSAGATRAEVLTLDDCIDLALKNRQSVIRARGEETRASADKRAALGAFLPSVDASYSYGKFKRMDYEEDGVAYPDVESTDKTLRVGADMWLLRVPNFYNYVGARSDKLVAHLNVIDSEQDLIYTVKTRFYAYLAAVQNITVQEEAVKRSAEQLKLIESKYELGSASQSDVLKQKVQYGNDRVSLLSAQNSVTESRAELAYAIGVDPNSEVDFSTDYGVREFSGTLGEALEFGLTHEPGLLSAEQAVKSSGHALNSRRMEYLPTLSGSASYTKTEGTAGFGTLIESSSKSQSIGFRVSWNIFDGFNRERNLSNAKVNKNNAMATFIETRNFVAKEIKTAFLELEKLRETKLVSEENLAAAEEDLKITQEKYNLGAATILDLLNAQVSMKQAQVGLVKADFDLNTSVARLENAMGKM